MSSRRNLRMKQYKNHFLVILAIIISDLFNYGNISIVIVSGYDNSLSHILFFESLMTTNLIAPFALNTIYLYIYYLKPSYLKIISAYFSFSTNFKNFFSHSSHHSLHIHHCKIAHML